MGKGALLLKLLQDVRASYWFLPSILVLLGLVLASAMQWVDRNIAMLPVGLPADVIATQAEGARSLLAVIAQSIIGVTGVMFSMTIVAVSFASGNFGPRLIENFMRDQGNQWSLGILIATFVYAIVVLSSVLDGVTGGVTEFVPQYSLLVALGLTLLCVFTMIYFVHHVPETINVSRISASLGTRLEAQLRGLIDARSDPHEPVDWPTRAASVHVNSVRSGYIQTCNFERLHDLADTHNWYIEMEPAIGDFINTETHVFAVWAGDALTDAQITDLQDCFAVGMERTENQNPSFLAHQLVEMIARALSPGVNDPYTALDCLNRLSAALTVASVYDGGLDGMNTGRVRHQVLDFERLFSVTFPQCAQYIKPDDLTRKHALGLLEQLAAVARTSDKSVISAEIEQLSSYDGATER
ncbi:DUF2254 domain-containing protein [Yoonia sediminilitoris]|uniref:Putative membrane protein n=1 Tax=Yoonia sediminilitoris TaxID=1286148 RepID=A0A2T6KHD4_9RHOB|nr:DUF2254 domain-containing protein [Yoonia sediminilitoris]PUB14929.1 putative membrane protein [Yoonia sediminilitoris]RCW95646.1 putative membrane protein [Yoonia sediminilitoris]